jgi:hypothetical protein
MRRGLGAVAVAVLLLVAGAQAASAKVLARTPERHPVFAAAVIGLAHPHHLGYKVTSKSAGLPVRVEMRLFCRVGRHWHREKTKFSAKPPIRRQVPLPVRHSRSCVFSVSASHDPTVDNLLRLGWINVILTGRAGHVFDPSGGED